MTVFHERPSRGSTVEFGVVVNHFSNPENDWLLEQSTRFAVALLRTCPEVRTIVVSDGSGAASQGLREFCTRLDARYLHRAGGMSFSTAFNHGLDELEERWVALLCSDVYVYPDTFARFASFIARHPDLAIGCLIPYLNDADITVQKGFGRWDRRYDALASLMTINLNVFPRGVLDALGGVPDRFSGNFNDTELCFRIARAGRGVYLVGGAYALHYGRLTTSRVTDTDHSADQSAFQELHPELRAPGGYWDISLTELLSHPALRVAYRAATLWNRVRRWGGLEPSYRPFRLLLRAVPRLQRIRQE